MKVNSTGLGKTTLTARITDLAPEDGGEGGIMMRIEAVAPVHWRITARLDAADVRTAARMVLKPSMLFKLARLMFQGGAGTDPAPRSDTKTESQEPPAPLGNHASNP